MLATTRARCGGALGPPTHMQGGLCDGKLGSSSDSDLVRFRDRIMVLIVCDIACARCRYGHDVHQQNPTATYSTFPKPHPDQNVSAYPGPDSYSQLNREPEGDCYFSTGLDTNAE